LEVTFGGLKWLKPLGEEGEFGHISWFSGFVTCSLPGCSEWGTGEVWTSLRASCWTLALALSDVV